MNPAMTFTSATGGGTWHYWCRLCNDPTCQCVDALVLATQEGADLLEPLTRRVEAEYAGAGDPQARAAALVGGSVVAFTLDVGMAVPEPLRGMQLPARADQAAGSLRAGQLEALHQRWRQLKGAPLTPPLIDPHDPLLDTWTPGDRLDWDLVCPTDTVDSLFHGGQWFQAIEAYCANPTCTCQEVALHIMPFDSDDDGPSAGAMLDLASGARPVAHAPDEQPLIEAWLEKNPDWRARAVRRRDRIRVLGAALYARAGMAGPPARRKVGRNEACPCGSGRKYKRCCGA